MSSPIAGRLSFPITTSADDEHSMTAHVGTTAEVTDLEILDLLRGGNSDAMQLLFDRYCNLILSIGLRILPDRTDAEDLVQEVFLYIFEKRQSINVDVTGRIARWIGQLSTHRALNRLERVKAGQRHQHSDASAGFGSIDELLTEVSPFDFDEWICRKVHIERALDSLPAEQRAIITMKCEGYDFHELGQKTGDSYGNVRNKYYRGLERLRQVLADGATKETSR